MNIDKVKLVDELATKGIEYYETSRGIFITKLNNDIAKLQDFPPTYDGKEVLGNTLFNPFPKDKTDVFLLIRLSIELTVIFKRLGDRSKIDQKIIKNNSIFGTMLVWLSR